MAETATVADFVAALRRCELADAGGWQSAATTAADAATLARELVRTGTLTKFQALRLLRNRGDELVVGPFVLLDPLGEGGMGQVYKARHRLMGRTVALKLVRPDRLDRPDADARFLQEVQAAARLTHPNIVQAFHAERTDRGFFLAMEFCDGSDLGRVIDDGGPLPVHLACDYVAQAAAGLSAAHDAGLVHRDIKPGNLILTAGGTVKVLDFGLARFRGGEAAGRLTRDGAVMGTPDFMSPEQARDSATVDIRADIYSLGCTLYFLLTGRVPFPGGTDWEKVLKHVSGSLTPVEVFRPEVPAGLAAVLRKMTARDPADRYHTPAEVEFALAPFRAPAPAAETEPAPSVTAFAPPFLPVVRSAATVAPPAIRQSPAPPPEAIPAEDEVPLAAAVSGDTLDGSRSQSTVAARPRRKSGAGVWAAVAAVAFAAAAVVIVAWPDRKHHEPEQKPATPVTERKHQEPEQKPGPPGPPIPVPPPPVPTAGDMELDKLPALRIAFHPKKSHILAVARGQNRQPARGGVEIWDIEAGTRRVLRVSDANPSVFAVAFTPNGKFLACGAGALDTAIPKAEVAVFETENWTLATRFVTDSDGVFALAFHPGIPRYLVAGTKTATKIVGQMGLDTGGVEVWEAVGKDWADGGAARRGLNAAAQAGTVNGVMFLPKENFLFAAASFDRSVWLWGFDMGKTIRLWSFDLGKWGEQLKRGVTPFPGKEQVAGPILGSAMYDEEGVVRWVAAVTMAPGPQIVAWSLQVNQPGRAGEPWIKKTGDGASLLSVAFAPDGKGLVTGDDSGRLRAWDLPDLKDRQPDLKERTPHPPPPPPFKQQVWGLAFSPDGKWLVAAGLDGDNDGARPRAVILPAEPFLKGKK